MSKTVRKISKTLGALEKYRAPVVEALDKSDKAINLALKLGLAYVGYTVFDHPGGSLFALVSFELAKAPNIAASVAGVIGLAGLGIIPRLPDIEGMVLGALDPVSAIKDAKKVLDGWNILPKGDKPLGLPLTQLVGKLP